MICLQRTSSVSVWAKRRMHATACCSRSIKSARLPKPLKRKFDLRFVFPLYNLELIRSISVRTKLTGLVGRSSFPTDPVRPRTISSRTSRSLYRLGIWSPVPHAVESALRNTTGWWTLRMSWKRTIQCTFMLETASDRHTSCDNSSSRMFTCPQI